MAGLFTKPEVGQVLEGRYLLERVIGEGGMGVVFAARHVELGELVAVKVLHPTEAMDEEHLERFLREARLAAKIKNDHVVRVIDVARGKGTSPPYIVMEYLDGLDLADLVKQRGPLQSTEAVDYILQACVALVEAHQLGIVHRDLKPSNLLLTHRADGTPFLKVLDFGISKTHDSEDSKLTTTRAVFGSPAYMSPEQIRSAKHVDARSDVWALAVVLFEVLTGRLPFLGETASSILAAVSADPPLPLSQYASNVPPGLQDAIEACLIKDRERRVPSVPDFVMRFAPFASPAAQPSIEAVRRIAGSARNPTFPPGTPRAAFDPTEQSLTPLFPAPSSGAVAAVGRTDRAIVVASRRSLKSRTSILAGIGIAIVGLVLVLGTWAFQRSRASASAPPSASWPEPPPSPTEAAATPTPTLEPAPPPTMVASTPRGAPSTRHAGAAPRGKHPLVTTTASAAATPAPPASTMPSLPAKPPNVDTDSRQ